MSLARLSLNQKTTDALSVPEAIQICRNHGIDWIGLWREPVAEHGLEATAALVRSSGLRVSSLCRGGFFPAETKEGFQASLAENRRAVDEAATLGTDVVVLVCGGIAGNDLARSRAQVGDAIADLAPYAGSRGVRLAIEPLHPMYGADRSVIVTLGQALDIAERHPPDQVGVVIDTFHLWWDPDVWTQIERASGRILSFQLADWPVVLPGILHGRVMVGDGVIDFPAFVEAVDRAGYDGPIEVEIFNRRLWATPGDEVVSLMVERFLEIV